MSCITYDQVVSKIITIRDQKVLLDSEVAEMYGVKTMHLNQAVSRNPDKFPKDYIIELTIDERSELITNCDRFSNIKHSIHCPKAFTEKGLYMLATILKSSKAINTTIAIIEAFTQIKELTNKVNQLAHSQDKTQQVAILEQGVDIFAELIDNELIMSQKETQISIKLPFLEFTRKITKVKN